MNVPNPSPLRAPADEHAVRGAGAGATADNRWTVPAQDFAALHEGAALCALSDHSVLEFDGPDAVAFLQSQTTADVAALGDTAWQLGGYCTPKGRLLAIFHAWRYESGVRLLLPAAIAAPVLRRLSMYVLRAKVRARDATGDWAPFALLGNEGPQALRAAGIEPPEGAWQGRALAGARFAALPAGAATGARLLGVVATGERAALFARLAGGAPLAPALWWWSQVDAAMPAIVAATSELFVPQTLNLEVLGGVSFRKGCYPGQEIVARSQYLGKSRRRMTLAHAEGLGPGVDIFASGRQEPVGRIVLAASAPGGGWDLLYECGASAVQAAQLHAGAPDAPPLQRRALPYELFDPTA